MTIVIRGIFVFRGEVIARVEDLIPEKLIARSEETVRARLGDDVDLTTGVAAEGRVVAGREHLELSDAVCRRAYAWCAQFWVDVVDAVQQEAVEVLARAVDRQREIPAC